MLRYSYALNNYSLNALNICDVIDVNDCYLCKSALEVK